MFYQSYKFRSRLCSIYHQTCHVHTDWSKQMVKAALTSRPPPTHGHSLSILTYRGSRQPRYNYRAYYMCTSTPIVYSCVKWHNVEGTIPRKVGNDNNWIPIRDRLIDGLTPSRILRCC